MVLYRSFLNAVRCDQSPSALQHYESRTSFIFVPEASQSWLDLVQIGDEEAGNGAEDDAAFDINPPTDEYIADSLNSRSIKERQEFDNITPDFRKITTLEELQEVSSDLERASVIYFIRQRNSFSRLSITRVLFECLITRYAIFPRIKDFITSFGLKSGDSEVGVPRAYFRYTPLKFENCLTRVAHSFECAYVLRFAELNHRDSSRPWSIRQTGVYHRRSANSKSSTWIIVAISQNSQMRLIQCLKAPFDGTVARPFDLHILLLDTAITNWRSYLVYIDTQIREQADRAVVADLDGGVRVSQLEERQFLKQVEDRIIDVNSMISSTLDTVTTLQTRYSEFDSAVKKRSESVQSICDNPTSAAFEDLRADLLLYQAQAYALRAKVKSASQLVSSLLDLDSGHALKVLAEESREENSTMRTLTQKATQDAAAVKVLTILTLIYLPATVVSNFFSTQFVSQIQTSRGSTAIRVNADWWILVASSLPLTVLTLYIWWFYVQKSAYGEYPAWWRYLTTKIVALLRLSPRQNAIRTTRLSHGIDRELDSL